MDVLKCVVLNSLIVLLMLQSLTTRSYPDEMLLCKFTATKLKVSFIELGLLGHSRNTLFFLTQHAMLLPT